MRQSINSDLNRYSNRTLELLALLISGIEIRVVLSARAKNPLTIVLESKTIVLNPDYTSLYDVILGAMLMDFRAIRNNGPHRIDQKDRWLTRKARLKVMDSLWDTLEMRFPRIQELPGRFRPGQNLKGLYLTVNSVEWHAMENMGEQIDQTGRFRIRSSSIEDLHITGCEDDFGWLESKIRNGEIPLQYVPGLEDLPYLHVPIELTPSQRYTSTEEWEQHIQDKENQSLVTDLIRCM